MERLEIITRWHWLPSALICRIMEIRGGDIPDRVRSQFLRNRNSPPDMSRGTPVHAMATIIVNVLGQRLPDILPLDVGSSTPFEGQIVSISQAGAQSSEKPTWVELFYTIQYANGVEDTTSHKLSVTEQTDEVQRMVAQVHRDVHRHVMEWFAQTYGAGVIDPEKWKALKTSVFISYRSSAEAQAEELAKLLGEQGGRTLFTPRINSVDMQAGNWLNQLMKMIRESPVFIPVLSQGYLEGPIAKPELDLALREYYYDQPKLIVPVLIEGSLADYADHFLGGIQMVEAQDGIAKHVDQIASLSLGLSKKPNKFE